MVNFFFSFTCQFTIGKKQQYNNNDNNNDNKRKQKRKEKLNMWNVFSLLVYDAFISGVIGRTLSGQSLQFSLCGRDWSHGVNCFHREGGRRLCEGVARKDKSAFNHNKKMIIQQYKQLSRLCIRDYNYFWSSLKRSVVTSRQAVVSLVVCFLTLVRRSHFTQCNRMQIGNTHTAKTAVEEIEFGL